MKNAVSNAEVSSEQISPKINPEKYPADITLKLRKHDLKKNDKSKHVENE